MLQAKPSLERVAPLIGIALKWRGEDRDLTDVVLDVLATLAPNDARTDEAVREVLVGGTASERALMLRRMQASFGRFSEATRSAALVLATDPDSRVRAAAVAVLIGGGDAADTRPSLAILEDALNDGDEVVVASALKVMAARGAATRPLLPSAVLRASSLSAPTLVELARALRSAGADRELLLSQIREAWARAPGRRDTDDVRDDIVGVLRDIARGGVDVTDVAREFAAVDGLQLATKLALTALATGSR
ncbi:MAG: hypothetical protein U1E39_17685 [Planctomycetota bacterium]